MLHLMSRQGGVICLDIQGYFANEPMLTQEPQHRSGIKVILMHTWLARLGLYIERATETKFRLPVNRHLQEPRHVPEVARHVAIQET